MAAKYQLHLVLFSASEVASGFAVAERICATAGYTAKITIVANSTASMVKQVKLRRDDSAYMSKSPIEEFEGDAKDFARQLDSERGLRLVLIAGLDKLDDFRRGLLKTCRHGVSCFEPHPSLEEEPERFSIVAAKLSTNASWFCGTVQAIPKLQDLDIKQESHAPQPTGDAKNWVVLSCVAEDLDTGLRQARSIIEYAAGPVFLLRKEKSSWVWFWDVKLPNLVSRFIPQMERQQRKDLAEQLEKYSGLDFEFVALICCSTFLASFGLLQNSAAVIIGAMLVAPLMTPILGAGLSISNGNRPLFRSSLRSILLGFVAALLTSMFFGLLVRFLVPSILNYEEGAIHLTEEMWSRSHPTAIDFLVGLVGGSAAAFARTRTHLADALAGAAIAAALVPPIATAGMHIAFQGIEILPPVGSRGAGNLIYGPVLLFIANMLTIMIGSSFVLWACGVRARHGHSQSEKWGTRMTFLLIILMVTMLVWIVQHP